MSKFTIPSRAPYQVRNPASEESLFQGADMAPINAYQIYRALKRMQSKNHQASSVYKSKGLDAPFKTSQQEENRIEAIIDNFNNNLKDIKTMCKFNKFNGKVTKYHSNMYVIEVDDKTIFIPFSVMHKFPAFPQSMMEEGHLKIGVNVIMVKKDEKTYYPDHETYGVTNTQEHKLNVDGTYLLKDAKPYKQTNSLPELMTQFNTLMFSLPEDQRLETLNVIAASNMTAEQKVEKLTSMIDFPLDFVESQTLEKKASLFYSPGNSKDDRAQLKEIVESIVAMCNSEEQKQCQLIVGVNDKTNKTCRLQDEIASNYPQMANLDQFQNTLLVPFIKSYTYDNVLLMSSLKYNWYSYNGDLILIIDINYHGDPIICKGGRLPYRCDSAKMVAEGVDLVNMVKKLTRKAA